MKRLLVVFTILAMLVSSAAADTVTLNGRVYDPAQFKGYGYTQVFPLPLLSDMLTEINHHLFNWTGEYVSGTAYKVSDVVSFGSAVYVCKVACTGVAPDNASYWGKMVQGIGSTWFTGTTAPSDTIGASGDFYFRSTTSDIYRKSTTWGSPIANIKGDAGPPGTNGGPGPAATITIGTVTTGAPGSSVTVTNSGTANDAVLNITIPKGDAGTPGTGSGNVNPAGATSPGHIAVFSDTSGNLIEDGGDIYQTLSGKLDATAPAAGVVMIKFELYSAVGSNFHFPANSIIMVYGGAYDTLAVVRTTTTKDYTPFTNTDYNQWYSFITLGPSGAIVPGVELVGKPAKIYANDITTGTLPGTRLPAPTATVRGGVAPTGTASGKFLRDDDTWQYPAGSGDMLKSTYDPTGINASPFDANNITLGTLAAARGGAGTVTGIMKANGAGSVSAATAGTDYVVPSGSITGNAGSATRLATARTINGVPFDGTASITVSGGVWGSITGTLATQSDLNSALAAKAPVDNPTFTTGATAPAFTSNAADGTRYMKPYNSSAYSGTCEKGMVQTVGTPAALQICTADGTWAAAGGGGGSGTIGGSTGGVDRAILIANGTGGSTVQPSAAIVAPDGTISTPQSASSPDTATWRPIAGSGTNGVSLIGPASPVATAYSLQWPNAAPTAGQIPVFGTPSGSTVPITWGTNSSGYLGVENVSTVALSSNLAALNCSGSTNNFIVNMAGYSLNGFTLTNVPTLTSGQVFSFTVQAVMPSGAYSFGNSGTTVNGSAATLKWQGATAPTYTANKTLAIGCWINGSASTTVYCGYNPNNF